MLKVCLNSAVMGLKVLTQEQVESYLACTNKRYLFSVGLTTGLHKGEFVSLL